MRGGKFERAAFWITVLLAGATVWIAPRPPLADLAQHAGQIQLWHDLVLGDSRWAALLHVNYFTPYIAGCGLALLLSFLLPVTAAVKLVLMLAYYGFVAACVVMRRRMGGERRLDWLFVPGFFGLAWVYGFFPFLVALPVAMMFIVLAHGYAERPSARRAMLLAGAGLVLFFSHGLAFLLAAGVGVAFLLVQARSVRSFAMAAAPFAALAVLCAIYLAVQPGGRDPAATVAPSWLGPFGVAGYLLFLPMGQPDRELLRALAVPVLLLVPWAMGCRIDWRDRPALVPMVVLLLWLLLVPEGWRDIFFAESRFAVFFLPFYALLFRPAPAARRRASGMATIVAAAACLAFVGVQAMRLSAFARESESFQEILAAAEPGQRAQQLVTDMASPAAHTPMAYQNFPLWYQVEKSGLVDFNFAAYATQVVRYREVAAQTGVPRDGYRYFFVRQAGPLPANFLHSGRCEPVLRKQAGGWMLFENVNCSKQ